MTTHYFHRSYGQNSVEHKICRSAVFLKIHLCEDKRKRCLVKILSIFSFVFVWATRRRAMERSWHLHSIYPILPAGRSYQNLDIYQNWHCLIENRFSRHVWLKTDLRWSHKLPNPKLIFKNCKIKANFDALVYDILSFKALSPFFNVCTIWLYTLSQCIGKHNQFGSHIITHWLSYAFAFCRKIKLISSSGLEHPNPYHTFLHCGNIPCLNTFVGSVRYLIILLR